MEVIGSIKTLSPILALRSLFTWEGEFRHESDDEMFVQTDPNNTDVRILYLANQDEFALKATHLGDDMIIEASARLAEDRDLCAVIAAWGLVAVPKDDGFVLVSKTSQSDKSNSEHLWDRILEIDSLWCNIHRLSGKIENGECNHETLIKIYTLAGQWVRRRMHDFECAREEESFEAKMLTLKIGDLDTWRMPNLKSVEVGYDIRGSAFSFRFLDGSYNAFQPLRLDWAVEKPFDPQRYAAATKTKFDKYDVRPTVVSADVRAVLASVVINGHDVKITQQLNKKLYDKVNEALNAIGGKWHTGRQAHVFEDDPNELLETVVLSGAVYTRKDYEFFWTSSDLAERVVVEAKLEPGMLVVEPSAGDGALATAAATIVGIDSVRCFELMPRNVKILRGKGFTVDGPTDFLKTQPQEIADRVIMNPPFSGGRDAAHIMHAMKWLKPGGLLVAIASTQWQTHDTRPAADFRYYLADRCARVVQIAAGAFKEAGTGVETTLIVVQKPVQGRSDYFPAEEEETLQAELF